MVIKRSLYSSIQAHLDTPEITLIAGPRQCGKTFLMKLLATYLEQNGTKTIFLNLDVEEDKKYFNSQSALISKIDLELGRKPGVVFIDEIQRKTDAGVFLKGIFDQKLPYKLIVSGSGSLELKEKIHESLAGRKKVFNLSPVSFLEFVNYKANYIYKDRLDRFFSVEKDKLKQLLNEYLRFGGYPRVIISSTINEKQDTIRDIFQSYVEKDIGMLLHLEKTEILFQLLKLLASSMGNLVNVSAISNSLGVSAPTVKNYLWYLEKTFIINRLTPFTRRTGREISKSPVVYFNDIGLRNFVNGTFTLEPTASEVGFNFQNLVFNTLNENLSENAASIHYFRTKDGAEVDFVIETGLRIIPIEAKYTWTKPVPRALINFQKKYSSETGLVATSQNFYLFPKNLHLS